MPLAPWPSGYLDKVVGASRYGESFRNEDKELGVSCGIWLNPQELSGGRVSRRFDKVANYPRYLEKVMLLGVMFG